MKIVKKINLNELKTGLDFEQLLKGLHPFKTYKRKEEDVKLQWVSSYSSYVEFQLENNEKVIMNLEEVLMDEKANISLEDVLMNEKLTTNSIAIFSNETDKLVISNNGVNANLTFEYSKLTSMKKDEKSLIENINAEWQEYVLENKFNNLIETDNEQSNDIFMGLSFLQMNYIRSIHGSLGDFTNVVEHNLTINFRGAEAIIGAAPGYNSEYKKKNWFLSPYIDVWDTEDVMFQIKDGQDFSNVFSLTKSQVIALNRMLTEFNLLTKTKSVFLNRQIISLLNTIKSIEIFSNDNAVISAGFVSEGTEIFVVDKEKGNVISRFTIFQDMLDM